MRFVFILSLLVYSTMGYAQKSFKLKKGQWISELHLSDSDKLPFRMIVQKKGKSYTLSVMNGEETIKLEAPKQKGDSLHVWFPYFNSKLVFAIKNKKQIAGYWQNFNKGDFYRIPFSSKRAKGYQFSMTDKKTKSVNLDGRWQVEFSPNTNSSYPAVGIFKQKEGSQEVFGTFLTETGDYRYLAGNSSKDSLFLSCFDGSHAFLFKAAYNNGKLSGKFFSGNHWSTEWEASRNENFELASPDELTYLKEGGKVNFDLRSLDGTNYSFPNTEVKNKVIIIQIMGSWCPNCLDETMYYKSLYDKYHSQGLEIISVAYEIGSGFDDYVKNIERIKTKLDLDFTFLVGGKANKTLASEQFSMLNGIISFPTSIFIGRDGEVKRIHTGFNGPGTGSYYKEYVENTNALVEFLLAE